MFSLNREILVLHPDLKNSLFGGFHYTQNLLATKDDKLVRWICSFFKLLKINRIQAFFLIICFYILQDSTKQS